MQCVEMFHCWAASPLFYTITSCTFTQTGPGGKSTRREAALFPRAPPGQELLCLQPPGARGRGCPSLPPAGAVLGASPLLSALSVILSRCGQGGEHANPTPILPMLSSIPPALHPSIPPSSSRRRGGAQMLSGPSQVHLFHMTQRQLLLTALLPPSLLPPPSSPSSSSSSLPGSSLAASQRRSRGPAGGEREEEGGKGGFRHPGREDGPALGAAGSGGKGRASRGGAAGDGCGAVEPRPGD